MTTHTKNYKDMDVHKQPKAPRTTKPTPRRRRIDAKNIAIWLLMILLIAGLSVPAWNATMAWAELLWPATPNVTTPATLPTAAVLQPLDKTDQQRPNPTPAPVVEVAPVAPVVKVDQERPNVAPVVAAPVVSESDKAHQAAPGTSERVQAVESTPEAQKGAQGRSGGVKEENEKGGREK